MAFVQLYRSSDASAPALSGETGKLTDLLDAVLVNGYSTASVSSLTRSGSTLTFVISSNTTLRTGDYIVSSGWDQSDYNGTFQITVTNATTFTAPVTSSQATTATGTGLYKKAPLGWATAFTGTNVRAYRSPNTASNRFYLRVDDSTNVGNVREAYVRGYESMTDIDTGSGPFPTVAQLTNGLTWNKSNAASSATRDWAIVGDDKTFYLFVFYGLTTYASVYGFGHFIPTKPGDGFNTFVTGYNISNWTLLNQGTYQYSGLQYGCAIGATSSVTANRMWVPREFTQVGVASAISAFDVRSAGTLTTAVLGHGAGAASLPFPNGPDSGVYVSPIQAVDHAGGLCHFRGRFPGIYSQLHSPMTAFAYGDFLSAVVGMDGVKFVAIPHSTNYTSSAQAHGLLLLDVDGPWV